MSRNRFNHMINVFSPNTTFVITCLSYWRGTWQLLHYKHHASQINIVSNGVKIFPCRGVQLEYTYICQSSFDKYKGGKTWTYHVRIIIKYVYDTELYVALRYTKESMLEYVYDFKCWMSICLGPKFHQQLSWILRDHTFKHCLAITL